MDWDRLITVEQMEAATNELLETGKKVGADSWQQRVKNQTPHCGFGEAGTCCRICSMGPCRITPKAPRGICGCDVHGIVGRNYLRFTAGGAATHSDHGRQICHTLYQAKEGGAYQVKDPEKLKRIAHEWDIETEGKDIYDLAPERFNATTVIPVMDELGVDVTTARQILTIGIASPEAANHLGIACGMPVAQVERFACDKSGKVVYAASMVHPGDRVRFEIDLVR